MNLAAWRIVLMVYSALLTGGPTLWVALRPTRRASRLGMRGLKRQRALLDPTWATLDPFIRWLGVRVSGILTDKRRDSLDKTLTTAGDWMGVTVDEYLALIVMGGAIGLLVGLGLAFYAPQTKFAIPAVALVGGIVPIVIVDGARAERYRNINRGLPYAIDLMSLSMSAGLDFPGAVQQVVLKAKANQALLDELSYILQQIQLGRTRAQVLKEFSERAPIAAVKEFVLAILQAEERGSPVAGVLEIQATTARVQRTNQAENAAHDMQTKLVLPIMLFAGVSLMLVMVPAAMMIDTLMTGLSGRR